jgi:hypothetical protein
MAIKSPTSLLLILPSFTIPLPVLSPLSKIQGGQIIAATKEQGEDAWDGFRQAEIKPVFLACKAHRDGHSPSSYVGRGILSTTKKNPIQAKKDEYFPAKGRTWNLPINSRTP